MHTNLRLPRVRRCVAILAIALPVSAACAKDTAPPVVAAAADLNAAMPELIAAFRDATDLEVTTALGSSGNFTQQVRNGAPFQVFLSADEAYVEALHKEGFTENAGALYAIGYIVLFVPTGSPIVADGVLREVAASLRDGRLNRLAIANPEHAPYGRAAQEALESAGLWDAVQPYLVFGENAAQATQFAATGSAQAGIVPLSLARSAPVERAGTYALIADSLYTPLRQSAVLLRGAGETARAFYAFLFTPTAREILLRYGFGLPDGGH